MRKPSDDDGVEYVPIPLDRKTRERLARLSRAVGEQPIHVAGSLLHDILIDDEIAHIEDAMRPGMLHS